MKKTYERAQVFAQTDKSEILSNYKEDSECEVIDAYIKQRIQSYEDLAATKRDIPLDIFPGIYGQFAKEYAKVYQHPNNYIFGSMLAAISTAIGMSVVLHTKKYKNSGSFYGMLIGKSGSAKTHCLEYFLNPILEIEKEITKKYNVEYNKWKRNETSGDKPIKQNISINSGTAEAILKRLENSPKGFVNYIDEIESFFKSRDPNSSAIPDLLTIWNNQRINKGLKDSQNDYNVESPFMNLLGGIQVEELVNRFKSIGTSNGLLWRFIPFINTQKLIPYENDFEVNLKLKETFNISIKEIYYSLYRDTIQIDLDTDKIICNPKKLLLDIESNIIYNDYVKYCIYRQNNTPNNKIGELLAKVKIYCLRFALIFHIAKRGTDFNKYPEIEDETMWRSIELSEHLFAAQKYCLDLIQGECDNIFGISKKYTDFYKRLPNEAFKTSLGNELAKKYKISERMVFEFYKNVNFFKKISHGVYMKTNFI